MAKKTYKFTDKKHTRKGMASLAFAAFSAVVTVYVIYRAYSTSGAAGSLAGLLGLLSMLSAAAGFAEALGGLREQDVYYVTAYAGAGLDGLLLIVWILICVVGM